MIRKIFSISLLLGLSISLGFTQEITQSISQKISSKAAAGDWIDYHINPEENEISFTFITKESKKSLELETYRFNMDLAFESTDEAALSLTEAEAQIPTMEKRAKAKQKDNKTALRVGKNVMSGQMVIEHGTISYGYAGRALITSFNTQSKIKPKGEDGSKLLLVHARTEYPVGFNVGEEKNFFGKAKTRKQVTATTGSLRPISIPVGDVCAIVYDKSGAPFQKYAFVIYDAQELTRELYKEIAFQNAYRPIYVKDMPNGDMGIIFAPLTEVDGSNSKKSQEIAYLKKPIFKYLRINMNGERVEEVDFELPKPKIGVPYNLDIIPASDPENRDVYIVGLGDPDFLGMGVTELTASMSRINEATLKSPVTPKNVNILIGKISQGELKYMHMHSPTEFFQHTQVPKESKVKVPQEKDAGKLLAYGGMSIADAQEIDGLDYITAHSYESGYIFVVQIDAQGELQHVYAENRGKVNFQGATLITNSQDNLYLMYAHQPSGKTEEEIAKNTYERSLEAFQIDPSSGEIQPAKSLLPSKIFVDTIDPIRFINEDEAIVLGHAGRKDVTLSKVKF